MAEHYVRCKKEGKTKVHVKREQEPTVLQIHFDKSDLQALATAIQKLSLEQEICLELPPIEGNPLPATEQWTLYVKTTQKSEKSLLSHPAPQEWVVFLLISERRLSWLQQEVQTLLAGSQSQMMALDAFEAFGYPSNVVVYWHLSLESH